MNNFFEELKKYFEVTPREKVLEDWAKSAEFNKVGPTIDEFLRMTQLNYQIHSQEPLPLNTVSLQGYSPEYPGFFLSKLKI